MYSIIAVGLFVFGILLTINSKMKRANQYESFHLIEEETDFITVPDERAYYDETNKAVIDLKKKIDEFGIGESDVVLIKELKSKISKGFDEWGTIVATLDGLIEERNSFVNNATFYPRHFTFDINLMQVKREFARDYQLENPLRDTSDFVAFLDEEKDKVAQFIEIKSKLDDLLPKLELYERKLKTKKDQVNYFTLKQELFIAIQEGDVKEAKQLYGRLRAKTKQLA